MKDARKRHKDLLKTDINRKKKHLDDIQSKHAQATDTYELSLNQLRSELALHGPQPSWDKNQLRAMIQATLASCTSALHRLNQNERSHTEELIRLNNNFMPIRLLSTQSNQKNLICVAL